MINFDNVERALINWTQLCRFIMGRPHYVCHLEMLGILVNEQYPEVAFEGCTPRKQSNNGLFKAYFVF